MKIFMLAPGGDWIVDQFVKEWNNEHREMVEQFKTSKEVIYKSQEFEVCASPKQSDVIFLIADWCWRQIDPYTLSKKKVIATVHHIVPEKFNESALKEFKKRDEFIDAYHVPCELTKEQIAPLTDKPIFCFPFWVNQTIWYPKNKHELRAKYQFEEDAFIIGSFQRDSEGHDTNDVFCDLVIALHQIEPKIQVLLTGKKRDIIINKLYDAGVRYSYQETPNSERLNDFYSMLDLYICGNSFGNHLSTFECAATRTPIISTRVGYAPELLSDRCIIDNGATWREASSDDVLDLNFSNVESLFIPNGFTKFRNMIRKVKNG